MGATLAHPLARVPGAGSRRTRIVGPLTVVATTRLALHRTPAHKHTHIHTRRRHSASAWSPSAVTLGRYQARWPAARRSKKGTVSLPRGRRTAEGPSDVTLSGNADVIGWRRLTAAVTEVTAAGRRDDRRIQADISGYDRRTGGYDRWI